MEDAERLESAKSTQSAERLESTESTQSAERLESTESTQSAERLESAERTQSIERLESAERLENAERTQSTQSTERLESAERIQSIERLESAEKTDQTDQTDQKEQKEHKAQRQQHKGEPDEITADDIANYFISPGKYAGDKKLLQDKIQKLDRYLLHPALCNVCEKQEETEAETIRLYDSLCSRCANETLLPAVIRKTLADTQGLSATKHYRESYFNEIIQNANDNTDPQKDGCRKMKVLVFRTGKQYQMSFRYKDKGFLTENIIGFFDTEIHTKSGNLAATGKHGVGIKSLFYFVEELNITSNVMITVSVDKKEEDGQQTIGKIRSSMRRSGSWDGDTVLTIRFSKKSSYDGAYHVEKLTELIDKAIDGSTVDACFFSRDQKELVFDIRGLLFTDKNIGKKQGIKEICFYEASEDGTERPLFTLSCEEHIPVKIQQGSRQADGKLTCLARRAKLSLSYHTDRTGSMAGQKQVSESYVLFTLEHDSQNRKEKQEQNFSVAFPEAAALQAGCPRFYETYYIPQHFSVENMENWNLQYNLLVNSQYSDVSRTKLTEDVTQLNSILKQIQEQILQVIRYMTLEAFWEKACSEAYPGMREAVSGIFHQMLSVDFYRKKDNGLAELCYRYGISNRYLQKSPEEGTGAERKYLVYCREAEEAYEKPYFGQKTGQKEIRDYVTQYIEKNDSISYFINRQADAAGPDTGKTGRFSDIVAKVYEALFSCIKLEALNPDGAIHAQPVRTKRKPFLCHLCRVLNVAGSMRDLIYYRVAGRFPEMSDCMLTEDQIDTFHKGLYDGCADKEQAVKRIKVSLLLTGRYHLHENISSLGEILGASFYRYIFSGQKAAPEGTGNHTEYPSFKDKAKELYEDNHTQYQELKALLLQYLRNPEPDDCHGELFESVFARELYKPHIQERAAALCQEKAGEQCKGHVCFYTSSRSNCVYLYYGGYVYGEYRNPQKDRGGYVCRGCRRCMECENQQKCGKQGYTGQCSSGLINKLLVLLTEKENNNELTDHIISSEDIWYANCLYYIDESGGKIYDQIENICEMKKPFSEYTETAVKAQVICLDFIQLEIDVKDFEAFQFYFVAFLKLWKKGLFQRMMGYWKRGLLYTKRANGEKMELRLTELTELFCFIHKNHDVKSREGGLVPDTRKRYGYMMRGRYSKYAKWEFDVCLTGSLRWEDNLCRPDLFRFIENISGIKVYAMQANDGAVEKELMYLHAGKMYVVAEDHQSYETGSYCISPDSCQSNDRVLLLIYNHKFPSAESAISQVLKTALGNVETVRKCKAFLSSDAHLSIEEEEFFSFHGKKTVINNLYRRMQPAEAADYQPAADLSVEKLKNLILARGNNDGKCACCGKRNAAMELMITDNQSADEAMREKYPQIYEVVCPSCRKLLKNSLKKSVLEKIPDETGDIYTVSYHCRASNTHQEKEIVRTVTVPDGVLLLCSSLPASVAIHGLGGRS